MPAREKSSQRIVPAPAQALMARSAALVARGLRDLSRESNWLVKKVFSGRSPRLAVSPAGQVSAVSPWVRHGAENVALYDIELGVALLALSVPGASRNAQPGQPAEFAWSPEGRHLVAAWGGWPRSLHAFDLNRKMFLGAFGEFEAFPSALVWSEPGNYFVANSSGVDARVCLWEVSARGAGEMPFTAAPNRELTLAECRAWPEWSESAVSDNEKAASPARSRSKVNGRTIRSRFWRFRRCANRACFTRGARSRRYRGPTTAVKLFFARRDRRAASRRTPWNRSRCRLARSCAFATRICRSARASARG